MNCPHCHKHISAELIRSVVAKLNRAKTEPPHPKILAPCPHCGGMKGVADLRKHLARCEKNPRVIARAAKRVST
jgi:hypothetical protein